MGIWDQKVKQGLEIETFPNIAKKHTRLILGSQGTKKSITIYPYDPPFFSYRANNERSRALFSAYAVYSKADIWPHESNKSPTFEIWQISFNGSLYYMEQFETIFIQSGTIWKFDALYKSALTFHKLPCIFKTEHRMNLPWLAFLFSMIQRSIWYAF